MGNAIWWASNGGGSGSTDVYYPIAQTDAGVNSTTEADNTFKVRNAGSFSRMRVYITYNTTSISTSVTFRKNNANGNQTFTISAGATGLFQDTTNSDSVSAGDSVSMFFDRATSITAQTIGCLFTPTGNNLVRVASSGYASFGTTSATRYLGFVGESRLGIAEDNNRQIPIRTDGTIKNFFVLISANARTANTTYKVRKNGADGSSSITVGSSQKGLFEDTTNTDSVTTGDVVCYSLTTTASGSGNITTRYVGCDIEYSGNEIQVFTSTISGASNSGTTSRWTTPYGNVVWSGSETVANTPLYGSGLVKQLHAKVSSNASTAALDAYVRIGSADTAVTFNVPATTTGTFQDTTNSAAFTDSQKFSIRTIKSNSGATTFQWLTCVIQFNSTFVPTVRYY